MQQELTFYALPDGVRLFPVHIVASSINPSSRYTHHLVALAILALLFAAVCGYALVVDDYTHWDASLSQWVHAQRNATADYWMLAITMAADLRFSTAIIAGLALMLLLERHWWLSCYLLCTFFSTTLSVAIIKSLTQRSRPALSAESTLSLMSFPSGHAARAVLVFGVLALLVSWGRTAKTRTLALLMAGFSSALVAASRVYLGVHWTSDVLAGAALAFLLLVGVDWQLRQHVERSVTLPLKSVLATVIVAYLAYCFFHLQTQSLLYGIGFY